jgi:NDP-4-keto-2,6-dideoxyhexose 3-C-methyltransferase
MYTEVKKCRICASCNLAPIFSLGEQSLTGVFPKSLDEKISKGPVDLLKCSECGLVQLKQSYSLSEMYGENYGYRSGLNQSMIDHLSLKIKNVLAMVNLDEGDAIIDIGSNDGTTLSLYEYGKYNLYGIDPTAKKFIDFYRDDINILSDFFSVELMKDNSISKAKIITSFSMFYDLEDPTNFAKLIKTSLHEDGLWVFEQSYLPFMIETNSFDTICHEHLEFYSLRQIEFILKNAGLKIVDLEFNNVNGGSISISATHYESLSYHVNTKKVQETLTKEREVLKLDSLTTYVDFNDRVDSLKKELMDLLINIKEQGKNISILGASTKGNVLLQYYGITNKLVDYVGEVNPDKFSSFTPGTLIPIIDEDKLLATNPDYLLVLPWHFKDYFITAKKYKGRSLIFALPEVELITP